MARTPAAIRRTELVEAAIKVALDEGLAQVKGVPLLAVSAATGKGLDTLIEAVVRVGHDPLVRVIVLTGAGDAFIGSFAAFLAQGAAPEAALTRAARYAADSITRRGAQKSYASAADFARFEAEHEARP